MLVVAGQRPDRLPARSPRPASRCGTCPTAPRRRPRSSRAFFQLTDYPVEDRAKVPSEELDVGGGRTLHVPKSLKGVAVFSFKRLCGEPRGAADYLAIARRYHTVIIVGIPVMGPDMRNEAARFVTLIDALYEHKVKLLAAADAEPEGLYPARRRQLRVPAHRQPPRGNAQRRISGGGPRHRSLTRRARTGSVPQLIPGREFHAPLARRHRARRLSPRAAAAAPPKLTPAQHDATHAMFEHVIDTPTVIGRHNVPADGAICRRPVQGGGLPGRRHPRRPLSHGQRDDRRGRHRGADRPLARGGHAQGQADPADGPHGRGRSQARGLVGTIRSRWSRRTAIITAAARST